ncbi:MAG: efflux RND transporter periplasmic adaptor subunit, partial [Parachlamydiaceae bacterium]
VREVRDQAEAVKQHSANVALKEALLARAEFDFHNRKFLVESEAVSQEDFYHSKTDYSAAQASLDLSIHQLEAAKITLGDTDLENHPLIERAKSELREAFLGLKRCSIFSPASGYIAKRSVQVGQSIQPTTPLLSVIPLNDIWVDANYKETQLRNIRIGQSVEIFADMYGNDVTFHGTVGGIQGGSGSVFSLLPPQNATGNWIKIVQRVPVRIYLDPKEIKEHPLFLGLSVYTKVDVGDTNGPMLGTRTVSKPLMKTDVFDVSFAEIDAVINEIVRSNFGIEK